MGKLGSYADLTFTYEVVVTLSGSRTNQPRFIVTRQDHGLLLSPHLFCHLRNNTEETIIKNRIPRNPPPIIATLLINPWMLPETVCIALSPLFYHFHGNESAPEN